MLEAKIELRKRILARREAMSAESRLRLSEAIFTKIAALDAFRQSGTVLAYASFGSEPVTDRFMETVLAQGKVLALPRVDREIRGLRLFRVREPEGELRPGVWGIREPDPSRCPPVTLAEVEFILVPGVVFDVHGGRTGYGGGYYDRLIAASTHGPHLVAAAFGVQIVPEVPMGPGDRRVDVVVTEYRTYPEQGDGWKR